MNSYCIHNRIYLYHIYYSNYKDICYSVYNIDKIFFSSTTAHAWIGSTFSTIVTSAYTKMAFRAIHIFIYYLKLFFIFYNLFVKNNYFLFNI